MVRSTVLALAMLALAACANYGQALSGSAAANPGPAYPAHNGLAGPSTVGESWQAQYDRLEASRATRGTTGASWVPAYDRLEANRDR